MKSLKRIYAPYNREKAEDQIIDSGLIYQEINGSFHITMPNGTIIVYYPQARKWRVTGKGVYYFAPTAKYAIETFLKNAGIKLDTTKPSKMFKHSDDYSIEEIQSMMSKKGCRF